MSIKKLMIIPAVLMMVFGTTACANSKSSASRIHHNHIKTYRISSINGLRRAIKTKSSSKKKIVITKNLREPNKFNNYIRGTGYSKAKYLRAYNPAHYHEDKPVGKLENARKKSASRQKKNVELKIPSNTTITSRNHKTVAGLNFVTLGNNIHINNLRILAPVDDFPQWDVKDGKDGNWNSLYDAISIKDSKNSSVSNSIVSDGSHFDKLPTKSTYNRQYQQHDGLIDITNGSNKILIKHNTLKDHDKVMLIGNSDSRTSDKGKLNTKLIGNKFISDTQRMPRVRFGHVEIKDNQYRLNNKEPYALSAIWECGKDATMYGSNNVIKTRGLNTKIILKKVARNAGKSNHKLNIKHTKINGKLYNIRIAHNKIMFKRA